MGEDTLYVCWVLLTTLLSPVWPIFAQCEVVEDGEIADLPRGMVVSPMVRSGNQHILSPAAAKQQLLQLVDIRVDAITYDVVGLLEFKVTGVTDVTDRLYATTQREPRGKVLGIVLG